MAKVTRGQGASFTDDELNDPAENPVITRAVLGGETQSAGNISQASGGETISESESPTHSPQKPAQTTEPLSNPSEETSPEDAAPSADGSTQETDKASSSRRKTPAKATGSKAATAKADGKKANVRSTDGDDDEFDEFE